MKKINIIFAALLLMALACKKDETVYIASSTLNVINAAIDAPSVKVNPGADSKFTYAKTSDVIGYGANKFYGATVGSKAITIVNASDTTKTLYSETVNLAPINTLYLTGQSPAVEGFIIQESNIPAIQSAVLKPDSSVYVRFVNLSPNSTPLNIKLTTGTGNEVSSLAYKGISGFKKYEAKVTTANYVFELRDAATNTLRLTYTMTPNSVRYRTISLVIRGIVVDPPATTTAPLGISQVTYY